MALGIRFSAAAFFLCSVASIVYPQYSYAACNASAASPQKISDFKDRPTSILIGSQGDRAGGAITSDVRDLVLSDPSTLSVILGLLIATPAPSGDVARAVGTGLGLAASMCAKQDLIFAGEIQSQLALTNSTDAIQQFAAVTGNQLIGSVGGGGGGTGGASTGASGGQVTPLTSVNSGSTPAQAFVANSVISGVTNYFTSTTTGLSGASSNSTISVSRSSVGQ